MCVKAEFIKPSHPHSATKAQHHLLWCHQGGVKRFYHQNPNINEDYFFIWLVLSVFKAFVCCRKRTAAGSPNIMRGETEMKVTSCLSSILWRCWHIHVLFYLFISLCLWVAWLDRGQEVQGSKGKIQSNMFLFATLINY